MNKCRILTNHPFCLAARRQKILNFDRYSEGERLRDCKDLVRFTGKMDFEGVMTMKIRSELDEDETDRPTEEFIPVDLDRETMERLKNRFLLVFPDAFVSLKSPKLSLNSALAMTKSSIRFLYPHRTSHDSTQPAGSSVIWKPRKSSAADSVRAKNWNS